MTARISGSSWYLDIALMPFWVTSWMAAITCVHGQAKRQKKHTKINMSDYIHISKEIDVTTNSENFDVHIKITEPTQLSPPVYCRILDNRATQSC